MENKMQQWAIRIRHLLLGCPADDITYKLDSMFQWTECSVCHRIYSKWPV